MPRLPRYSSPTFSRMARWFRSHRARLTQQTFSPSPIRECPNPDEVGRGDDSVAGRPFRRPERAVESLVTPSRCASGFEKSTYRRPLSNGHLSTRAAPSSSKTTGMINFFSPEKKEPSNGSQSDLFELRDRIVRTASLERKACSIFC
jgi:hypothetical protein